MLLPIKMAFINLMEMALLITMKVLFLKQINIKDQTTGKLKKEVIINRELLSLT